MLNAKLPEQFAELVGVTVFNWSVDVQLLENLGLKRIERVSKSENMAQLLREGRADFAMLEFASTADLSVDHCGVKLVAVPQCKVALPGSRSWIISKQSATCDGIGPGVRTWSHGAAARRPSRTSLWRIRILQPQGRTLAACFDRNCRSHVFRGSSGRQPRGAPILISVSPVLSQEVRRPVHAERPGDNLSGRGVRVETPLDSSGLFSTSYGLGIKRSVSHCPRVWHSSTRSNSARRPRYRRRIMPPHPRR